MAKEPPHLTISKSDDVHIVEFMNRKILEELVMHVEAMMPAQAFG